MIRICDARNTPPIAKTGPRGTGAEVLRLGTSPVSVPDPEELLIKVTAAAVNTGPPII